MLSSELELVVLGGSGSVERSMARRLAAIFIFLAGAMVSAFRQWPIFKQCDPRWGADEMGTAGDGERSTICGEGCAMSSLAMVR